MDQASALREIVGSMKKQKARAAEGGARVICVTSGKGGVGKTSLAVNMALSMAGSGLRVILLDADFGLSNVDVMMGVSPPFDLSHVVSGKKTVSDVLFDGPGGVGIISGGSGLADLLNLSQIQLANILENLLLLESTADIIFLDTGAGVSPGVLRLVEAAGEAVIVTTPEPTAIMDAYALVKNVAAGAVCPQLSLIVNRADTVAEAEATMQKFMAVVRLYLQKEISPLGYVLSDPVVKRAVRAQQPFVLAHPRSIASRSVESIARKLAGPDAKLSAANGGGLRGFLAGLLHTRSNPDD